MANTRQVISISLVLLVGMIALAVVMPHLINAIAGDDGSEQSVPTFTKFMSGLGILESEEVEELTLSQIEDIEALKTELQDSLEDTSEEEVSESVVTDLAMEIQENNQFNNISTGDFVMEDKSEESELVGSELTDLDLIEP